jgi:hypothetical protein
MVHFMQSPHMIRLALISAGVGALAGSAHAQLLNGNFEDTLVTASNLSDYGQPLTAGWHGSDQVSVADWTVDNPGSGGSGVQIFSVASASGYGFGTTTTNVIQDALGGGGANPNGIHQLVTTVMGDTYTLTVDIDARSGAGTSATLAVGTLTLGGASESLSTEAQAFVTSTPLTFVATSTSTLVDIAETTGGNDELGIKNVVLTQEAPLVPEPSTYLLMGMGLVGMVAMRRFRKSSAL